MNYLDDLKANFRSWERFHDNEKDANALWGYLVARHGTNTDPLELKEVAYDWVGYTETED